MRTIAGILLLVMLFLCTGAQASDLYVRKAEHLPEDFFLGMDVSSVLSLEASGVRYRDTDSTEKDLFALLSENGVNLIRVRVWNDPFDSDGNGYGGGNNNIEAAVEIGRRAAAYGLPLLVDFHYSDFWADPSKQQTPKAWEGMDIKAKAEALYTYTADCLSRLKAEGIRVSMVQLGNETNGRMCGERIWMNIVHHLMKAGSRAVREVYPDALVAVHFTNPESADTMLNYASKLAYYDLDYDVFGTSYYPYWHGTLDNLRQVLGEIAETYGKKVMVMETSYAYTLEDGDFSGNTIGEGGGYEKYWPVTVQGQSNALQDVVRTVQEAGGIIASMLGRMHENEAFLASLSSFLSERSGNAPRRHVAVGGASKMLTYPEYADVEKVKSLLSLVETRDKLASIIAQNGNVAFTVRIGPESGIPEMADCSIVTATYSTQAGGKGTIGVIGPTRMRYSKVLSVLGTMGQQLSELFGAQGELEDHTEEGR